MQRTLAHQAVLSESPFTKMLRRPTKTSQSVVVHLEQPILSSSESLGEEEVAGGDVQITHEPERPGEIRRNWTDIGKAQRILGYQPSKQLAPSLAQMHEWFQGQRAEVTESAIVSPTVSPTVSADDFMDADEEEAVAKRLRDLGYL